MVDTARLDELERAAADALMAWLEEHPPIGEEGHPLVWSDGKPVALDVLAVTGALRRHADR